MRFDDAKYVEDYLKRGSFPKIHDDIMVVARDYVKGKPVMDLGACTGLLSAQLVEYAGAKLSVAVEGNQKYIERGIYEGEPNIHLVDTYVSDLKSLYKIYNALSRYKVEVVIARRVFPEIHDAGGMWAVDKLSFAFINRNVKYLIIEGRRPNSRSKHALKSLDDEVAAHSKYFVEVKRVGHVAVLKKIG